MSAVALKPAVDRREAIMAAARACFFERGFDRTSIDAVAAEAKVSKQTIYEFFASKTKLFEAVVRATLAAGREHLDAVATDTADPRKSLERFAGHLFARFVDPSNLGLFRASIVATRQMPKLAADLHRQRLGAGDAVGRFVEELAGQSVLETTEPMRAGVRLGGLVTEGSRYFLAHAPPAGAERKRLIAANVTLFLDGYRAASDDDQTRPPASAQFIRPELGQQVAVRLVPVKLAALFATAAEEFLALGYARASLDRVARSTGVSKSTLHRQFVDKQGLFAHVVGIRIHKIAQALPPTAPTANLEHDIATLAAATLDAHLAGDLIALHHLMIEEAAAFGDLARSLYDAQIAAVANALAPLLAAHGWPCPGARGVRAFHTLATFGVRFLTAERLPGRRRRDDLAVETARIFLYGLAAQSS
ncbi:MAG: TetR family transcriptional regulator [Novosphingobium sp.]|nr:TetR family transcriptional regulator [Novosphingobium sp.]